MPTPILKLPFNTIGNDYVIGDLHGCYDLLERLLAKVQFDPGKDRLFSVGDLVDRGPDSLRCLELLSEPWFFAVMGNHELMLLDFFSPYLNALKLESFDDLEDNGFLQYGGDWVKNYFEPEAQRMAIPFNRCLLETLKMPSLIVVGEGDNRFHVIHAELVKTGSIQNSAMVWLDSDIDDWLIANAIPDEVLDALYWERSLMLNIRRNPHWPKRQDGLSTTFCGHTFAHTPRRVLSHINIDTGAFMHHRPETKIEGNYSLTLYDLSQSKWLSASYQREEVIENF